MHVQKYADMDAPIFVHLCTYLFKQKHIYNSTDILHTFTLSAPHEYTYVCDYCLIHMYVHMGMFKSIS